MASYSFPKTSLTFNFEGGTSALPIIVQSPSSYENLVEELQKITVRMLKKVPIMQVYKGPSPNGTLVGTYLLDDDETKESLIKTAGSTYYTSDSGNKENVYEDVNNILFPSTEFVEECFFTVTTPKTREDDSPNLMFTASENTVKGVNRELTSVFLSDSDSYLDTPSYSIQISQTSFIAEGYFLLVREGVEYLVTSDDPNPSPTYKGSTISSLYLKQGKRVINEIINGSNLPKIKLDRDGYELRLNGFNGTKLTSTTLPSSAKSYEKFLATISYEGCSACSGCFKINSISYEDASDLEDLMSNKSGVVVFRNKTNSIYTLCTDIVDDYCFYPNESVYGSSTTSKSFNLCLYYPGGDLLYTSGTSIYADKLRIYDIYEGCGGIACYPVILSSHGNSALNTRYVNNASTPVKQTTTLPTTLKLGTTSNKTGIRYLTATGVHDYVEQENLYYGVPCLCIEVTESVTTDDDPDGAYFNKEVQTLYSLTNRCETAEGVTYFGAAYAHDKSEFTCLSTEFSGSCTETYPVSYVYVSSDYNEENTSGCCSGSCSCSTPGGSGCGTGSLYYGSNLVGNVYYGDTLIQAIYYGDTKIR